MDGGKDMEHPPDGGTAGYVSVLDMDTAELARQKALGHPVFRLDEEGKAELVMGCHFGDKGTSLFTPTYDRGTPRSKNDPADDIVIVGSWTSSIEHPQVQTLHGYCEGATHVAHVVQVGAAVTAELTKKRLDECLEKAIKDARPPEECNIPINVLLMPLDKSIKKIEYHFVKDQVVAAASTDMVIREDELSTFASKFNEQLEHAAKAKDINIVELSGPSEDAASCHVGKSTKPNTFTIGCYRGGNPIFQIDDVEPQSLDRLAPRSASDFIARADPTAMVRRSPKARRIVLLVDVSLSMVVNDEATFTASDIRLSKRYQMVMLMMRALQENHIDADISIISFGSAGCLNPIAVNGKSLWPVTDESREYALAELRTALASSTDECYNSTDLVGPLRKAGELLRAPTSKRGKDVVFLITDGAQQAQEDTSTPQQAARELQKANVELSVVRVQLNDLTELRKLLHGPTKSKILGRWGYFIGESEAYVDTSKCKKKVCSTLWEKWLDGFAAQNDDGVELFTELDSIALAQVIAGTNDVDSNALVTVHDQMVPWIGGLDPVYTSNYSRLKRGIEGADGLANVVAEYDLRAVRGRPFVLRIAKPDCMGAISSAVVTASQAPMTRMRVDWEDGSIVSFDKIQIGEAANSTSGITLTVEGAEIPGTTTCQD